MATTLTSVRRTGNVREPGEIFRHRQGRSTTVTPQDVVRDDQRWFQDQLDNWSNAFSTWTGGQPAQPSPVFSGQTPTFTPEERAQLKATGKLTPEQVAARSTGQTQRQLAGLDTGPVGNWLNLLPPQRDFQQDPMVQQVLASLSNSLANPDVINEQTAAQMKAAAADQIRGRGLQSLRGLREDAIRRGALDSGAQSALRLQGEQQTAEDIAQSGRAIDIERATARAANERAIQNTALAFTNQIGGFGLGADQLRQSGVLGAGQLALGEQGQRIGLRAQDMDALVKQVELELGKPVLPNQKEFLFELQQLEDAWAKATTQAEKDRIAETWNSVLIGGLNILAGILAGIVS